MGCIDASICHVWLVPSRLRQDRRTEDEQREAFPVPEKKQCHRFEVGWHRRPLDNSSSCPLSQSGNSCNLSGQRETFSATSATFFVFMNLYRNDSGSKCCATSCYLTLTPDDSGVKVKRLTSYYMKSDDKLAAEQTCSLSCSHGQIVPVCTL